jgi:dCTP deaminase
MSFWSSQTLESRLTELLDDSHSASVDCNALQLRIGREIYITPNLAEANTHIKQLLGDNQPFVIPPGQFGFLLTEEIVAVPADAMALISMKATFKMKGLVNVSGFHVDPGWRGRLVFAVFNAGPQPIHLHQGLKLFLIWYASLDAVSEKRKEGSESLSIPSVTINNLTGGSDSFVELSKKLASEVERLEERNKDLEKRIHKLDVSFVRVTVGCASVAALIVGFAFKSASAPQPYATPVIERAVPSAAAPSASVPSAPAAPSSAAAVQR